MEKKNLIVNVSGEVNTGKSSLTSLLKNFLRENGFQVQFDGGVDFENESQFDESINNNLEQAIEHIKDTVTITLKEVQVNSDLL